MRWTVRQRLVLSFFLMAILMAAGGAFSIYNLNQLNTSTEEILRKHQPVLTDMAAIESGVLFHSLKVDQYVTTGNKAHLRAVEELRKDVETHLADLESQAQGTEDQQLVQEIMEAYKTYVSLSDGLRAFYQRNPDDIASIEGKQMRIAALLENALLAKADALYEAKQSKAQELVQANHQLYLAYIKTTVVSSLILTLLAIALGVLISRSIIVPVSQLVEATQRIASWDLTTRAQVRTGDEIGLLANAFNSMAVQLRELVDNLERRVAERTQEYEQAVMRTQQTYAQLHETHKKLEVTAHQAQRRAIQLETAAEVSRVATSVLDPNELVRQAVDLIRDQFDLYYVGLFLLDESGRWAVLQAGTGEPGRQMLKANHKLEVSGQSMVGWCTINGRARIALDVGEEAVRFDNPLLPETRSEMALPLISRGRVIGALDAQSVWANAFSDEDVSILQTMADQIAVAIDNARLFGEVQARLKEVQAAHRSYLQKSWEEFLPTRETTDYEYVQPGVTLLSDAMPPEVQQVMAQQRTVALPGDGDEEEGLAQSALVTPITLRGQIIGALGLHETEETRQWTADEIALIENVADQMALAIENARLFEEARIRADELAALNELGQALTARLDVEEVLKETYRGASRLLDTTNFYIGLYDPEKNEIALLFDVTESAQDAQITVISADQGLSGYIVRNRKSMLLKDNVRAWQETLGIEMVGEEALSWLGVPLMIGDQVLGVIAVQSFTTPRLYDEHDRDLLTAIASQAAIAIQNAQLFEQTQAALAQTDALYGISRGLNAATNEDEILQTLAQPALEAGVSSASLQYIDLDQAGEPEWLETVATWQQEGTPPAPVGTRFYLPEFSIARLFLSNPDEPQLIADVAADERMDENTGNLVAQMGIRAFAAIPLAQAGRWVGLFTLNWAEPHEFSEQEAEIYRALIGLASPAVENRRLSEGAQARARRERILREITARVRGSTDPTTIMRTAVRELGTALGRPTFVRLGNAEQLSPVSVAQVDGGDGQSTAQQEQHPELVEGGE